MADVRIPRLGWPVGVAVVVGLLFGVQSVFAQTVPDFEDVPEGHIAEVAIDWAAENGITLGVGGNRFGMGQTLTRFEMVTFLCRAIDPGSCLSGSRGSDRFDDVPSGHWANYSVGWAVNLRITAGVSASEFGGSQTLTREQMITFLYRAKGSPTGGSLGSAVYGDVPDDHSQWANLPIGWAFDQGITGGVSAATFGFGTNLSREEMVLFLCRTLASDTCQPSQQPLASSVGATTTTQPVVRQEPADVRASYSPGQTGIHVFGTAAFDRLIPEFMEKWDIPGAAVAIAKDGRLVFAKGYGFADAENKEPVLPDALFRIGSVSKPVTAVAVLTLVEDGLLDLDERAFDVLHHIEPVGGEIIDSRYREITVRQLLYHSGASAGGDLMINPLVVDRPVECTDVIRYALGVLPLDFDPGTQYGYSNFGYCILGRIIEEKSGQPYEGYVKEKVFAPIGITRMQIGGTLLKDRVDDEVRYYWSPRETLWTSNYPDGPRGTPPQYGGIYLPRYDAPGGWIGSSIDLLRFVTSLDGSRPPAVLEPDTVELMLSRHDPPLTDTDSYYGMGWQVTPVTNGATWIHTGAFWGAHAILIRTHDGLVVAVLFNSGNDLSAYYSEGYWLVWEGISSVGTLPTHDLFPLFGFEQDAQP